MSGISSSMTLPKSADRDIASSTVPLSETNVADGVEGISAGSSPFSNEEWEEWMKWDGVVDALAPQHQLHYPDVSVKQVRPLQPANKSKRAMTPFSQDTAETDEIKTSSKKRRSSVKCSALTSSELGNPIGLYAVKRSHTVIEKRYRTNLNQKIAALRESVPSLRADSRDSADLGGLTPASKLNKATVLSKAIEYIQYLERCNESLEKENAKLRVLERPSGQRDEIDTRPMQDALAVLEDEKPVQISEDASPLRRDPPPSVTEPEGMIRVPDGFKRLRSSASQDHDATNSSQIYASGMIYTTQQGTDRSKLFGRIMIGSLAGLLVMEGFTAREASGDQPSGRGLFSLPTFPSFPLSYLPRVNWTLRGNLGVSGSILSIPPLFKLFLVVSASAFALFLYLFSSKPKPPTNCKAVVPTAAPSLASPIEVRQKAWLTAIQTVGVPRHRMFPELIALHSEAMKYVLRQLIGWTGYAWLTGQTEEDEIARVRAWDIAIDAQLTGGDSEVSKSRLVLTIFASGTLPSTPARLMLKALHIRILLWEATKSGWSIWCILHKAAAQLARQQWLIAQEIQNSLKETDSNMPDNREALPEHQCALLQLDSDELFKDLIVQRAYNLAWNRPTREDTVGEDVGIDIVVEDYAIRSPLDALAAWASSLTLQQALLAWYKGGAVLSTCHHRDLEIAHEIAPPASSTFARALAAKAVFFETDRESNIAKLVQDLLPPTTSKRSDRAVLANENIFVNSSIPELVRHEINSVIQCAATLESLRAPPLRKPDAVPQAIERLASIYLDINDMTLLGFAAAHQLLSVLVQESKTKEMEARLKCIVLGVWEWVAGPASEECKLDGPVREAIGAALDRVLSRLGTRRRLSDVTNDTGYESMSEDGENVRAANGDIHLDLAPAPTCHWRPKSGAGSHGIHRLSKFYE